MTLNLLDEFLKNHNFDESSDAWMKNKIKINDGVYKYVCGAICKNGKKCRNIE